MDDALLTREQQELKAAVRQYARERFAKDAYTHDPRDGFMFDRARELADRGFTGIDFPPEVGGQGGTLLDAAIVLSEIAAVCPHTADVVQAFNFGGIRQLHRLGGPTVIDRWLRPALRGELLVGLAMTEPEAGSDLRQLRTTAVREGDEVLINGQKIFSSHGLDSHVLVVWCRFGDRVEDIGAVVVPTDVEGFTRGPAEEYMSGERYCAMYFDGVRLPADHILTDRDGFRRMLPIFNVERLGNATRALTLAQTAFELAVDHAKQREAFGKRLADQQGLQWKFADMRMRLDAGELLLHRAFTRVDENGYPTDEFASIAKCYINQAAFDVANEAVQIFGGYGYSTQYPVEYIFRRTRGWMIAGGSVEVLKNRIARKVLR